MDSKQLASYRARARIIKALAHPARLLIVDELADHGEQCVCELTDWVGIFNRVIGSGQGMLRQVECPN